MKTMSTIESKVNQLPPELVEELNRYLDYLMSKRIDRESKKLTQNWAGGLHDIKMSATELQKKALVWRGK